MQSEVRLLVLARRFQMLCPNSLRPASEACPDSLAVLSPDKGAVTSYLSLTRYMSCPLLVMLKSVAAVVVVVAAAAASVAAPMTTIASTIRAESHKTAMALITLSAAHCFYQMLV